uniref:Uncharacterized protein n=1 Tax=Mycena chlorophos TaxID=658473 RepID=A0ABQ0L2D4_MYCCL|nr:predicted protein [Mycena chlorophos]
MTPFGVARYSFASPVFMRVSAQQKMDASPMRCLVRALKLISLCVFTCMLEIEALIEKYDELTNKKAQETEVLVDERESHDKSLQALEAVIRFTTTAYNDSMTLADDCTLAQEDHDRKTAAAAARMARFHSLECWARKSVKKLTRPPKYSLNQIFLRTHRHRLLASHTQLQRRASNAYYAAVRRFTRRLDASLLNLQERNRHVSNIGRYHTTVVALKCVKNFFEDEARAMVDEHAAAIDDWLIYGTRLEVLLKGFN